MLPRVFLAAAVLALSACQTTVPAYAPPPQFQAFEDYRPTRLSRVVNISDPDLQTHVVSGVLANAGPWAWTAKRVALKVKLYRVGDLRYTIDFTVADVTFKVTGPVQVTFLVNDHALGTVRYDKPGTQHYEKPVPSDWVMPGQDVEVAAEVDKVWTSPTDGAQLGLILTRMGLTAQ